MIGDIYSFLKANFGLIPSIVALIAMHYMVGGITVLSNVFLVIVYIVSLFSITYSLNFSFDKKWLYYLLYLPFTIILAQPDGVFKSWSRLALFMLLFLAMSPVIHSEKAINFREKCFNMAMLIAFVLSFGSFFAYFLGVNLFRPDELEYLSGVPGIFSGLTKQSMMLAPISGLSSIYLFYQGVIRKKRWCWIFFLPCMGSLLFSASRSAFGATIIGLLGVLFYAYADKKLFVKHLFYIVLVTLLTLPLWEGATVALVKKHTMHKNDTELFDSRSVKYKARIEEFVSSPIWGVGFAAIDESGKDKFNKKTGTIEPGSSWLCVLSMTGLIGFLFFVYLMWQTFFITTNIEDVFLVGFLLFFFVHFLAEGYVFAAGSPTAFLCWIIIGHCYDKKYDIEDSPNND